MSDPEGYGRLLTEAANRALHYLETIPNRRVFPSEEALGNLKRLGGRLPEGPEDSLSILRLLDEIGSPATVGNNGGRYFGFVVGGALPSTVAANWLAGAWDQNASVNVLSPIAAHLWQCSDLEKTEWCVRLLMGKVAYVQIHCRV